MNILLTTGHFEILSYDVERSKKFYSELYGWNFKKWMNEYRNPEMPEGMEYWEITATDDKGNKSLTGGILKRQDPEYHGITNYICVNSIEEYTAKVQQLGGKVMMCKTYVPEVGYYSIYSDTEGNIFAIWETDS